MSERIIIWDVASHDGLEVRMTAMGVQLVDPRHAIRRVQEWSGWGHIDHRETCVVFPGRGGEFMRTHECGNRFWKAWQCVAVSATRFWEPGEEPRAVSGRMFPNQMVLGIREVVIVDDVASSGATCRAIRAVNDPWIPGAKWHAVAMVAKRRKFRGFVSYFGAVECGSDAKINSLSTLLENRELREDYAKRNFVNPQEFLALISRVG